MSEKSSAQPVSDEHRLYEEEYKPILRKMDLHILPIITLLYLFNFLDRANIGNAKIAGLTQDLHLKGLQYNIAVAVLYPAYSLADIPSNIILKFVRPSRWIPSIMLAWGIVMTLMCRVESFQGLVVARVFLGICEGGFFPGIAFYLSLWYRGRDYAWRVALFFSAATIAGAFGGLFAFSLEKMRGIGGLHGWQWIFLIEGLLTVVVACTGYFLISDFPEDVKWLSERERHVVVTLLAHDKQGCSAENKKEFVWQALRDYKTYIQMVNYIGFVTTIYAIALFTPSIIKGLGYTAASAQLLTVPIFTCACISTFIVTYFSDKYNIRGFFILGSGLVSLTGYIILYHARLPGVAYVGSVVAASGAFAAVPAALAWTGSSAGGDFRRAITFAMVIAAGNLGGICSSFIYITPARYYIGHAVIMGCITWSMLMTASTMWIYHRINKKKAAQCEREGIDESRRSEFQEMGNESPLFRYTL